MRAVWGYTFPQESPRKEYKLSVLVFIAALVLFALSLTPYLRVAAKAVDLPSHFPLQYAIGAAILLFFAAAFDASWRAYIFIFAAGLLSMSQLMPHLSFGRMHGHEEEGKPLKILQANVLKLNADASRLRRLIEDEQPDIVVAAEVRKPFAEMFQDLTWHYPYQRMEACERTSYGMAVASKLRLENCETLSLDGPGSRAISFRVRHEGEDIDFLSLHPATPNRDIASRDREFENAVQHCKGKPRNLVVLGDLNATPYCFAYKKMTKALGLRNAREGFGLAGTFPVFLPFSWLRIPIDHVLASENLHVSDFRPGPDIGSDHLPTITTLTVASR